MRLAILGAGAMGLTTSALAVSRGHDVVLWSPSGASTKGLGSKSRIESTGALSGNWSVSIAQTAKEAVADAEAVLLAVDANGHRTVMEAVAPHMQAGIPFIISAAHSLSGLYMAQLLQTRGIDAAVVSLNTSPGTAHRTENGKVDIRVVRAHIEASVTPNGSQTDALNICAELLPAQFARRESALAIGLLANCNPVFHVPVCLLNITRIEHPENWAPYGQTTPAVGRMMEALDRERLAIAAAFGFDIHSVNEHFHRSFKIPLAPMDVMNATLHASGRGPTGPKTAMHRYLMQDIPYGLAFASRVARVAGVPAPIHDATVLLAGSILDVDFAQTNTILDVLGLDAMSHDQLIEFATTGLRPVTPFHEGTSQ